MIIFNPRRLFLNNINEVEICLDNNGNIKKYPMTNEKGIFKYEEDSEYTNYFFESKGRTYCTHKIEYVVVSTMSSGKSTFINALMGKNIMPSENQACTGKIFKLESLFGEQKDMMCIKRNGKLERYLLEEKVLKKLNLEEGIDQIDIQVKYPNIHNNISIYDTPGVNSFQNKGHKDVTYSFLEKSKIKNIIYIFNATNLATEDDQFFLLDIEELKNKKDLKIMFILNKIDNIDKTKENKEKIIEGVEKYIKDNGFENYSLFPLSAYCAKLIRKALNNNLKTRAEILDLKKYYNLSKIEEDLEKDELISIINFNFSVKKLEKMLEETGIIQIEKALQNINEFNPTFSLRVI